MEWAVVGMGCVAVQDETGRLLVALPPQVASEIHRVLRKARVVQVLGRVERVGWYRALLGVRLAGWDEG
ncbi:MAG: hypothetical protein OJF49_003208 [Ktedonobacterales bacterium]|jgi:hypothetical protein|nr:MAG: hypothetical protein OJF49_003208 [Ktedonobacterales bacterium]